MKKKSYLDNNIKFLISIWNTLCNYIDCFLLFIESFFNNRQYSYVFVGSALKSERKNPNPFLALFFAAEDEGRTFDPTERKIQKAREEGRVAKTQELPSSLILLAVIASIWLLSNYYLSILSEIFRYYLQLIHSVHNFQVLDSVSFGVVQIMRIILPIFIIVFIIGVLGNVAQVGLQISFKPITPDVSRVGFNLSKWFEKMFSAQGWYTLGFTFTRILLVSAVVFFNIMWQFDNIALAFSASFIQAIGLSGRLASLVILESAGILLLLSFIDFRFQTYLFREQLKMTQQEIKDELKESEGDPEVRRRIQSRMREFMAKNVRENVKSADVLITNPTHFAVALKYDRNTMIAPIVTVKGEDSLAFQMRQLAKEFDVPIIENKPLARALYRDIEEGEAIPERYYRAVVLVFEQVYKMKGMDIYE